MASIRKRDGRWQVQIRRAGHPPLSKSFGSRVDAASWAREKEHGLDRGKITFPSAQQRTLTIGQLLARYELEITPTKRGAERERFAIRALRSYKLGNARADGLTTTLVAEYRDHRLRSVAGTTVRRELAVLFHCMTVASNEWGFPNFGTSLRQVRLPPLPPKKFRRLHASDRIWSALDQSKLPYLKPLVVLAVETGMRRGELLALRWQSIDLDRRTAWLPMTKNGTSRVVPLSSRAIATIHTIEQKGDRLFPVSANAVRLAWERLRTKAGMETVRFHDLRHEAVSRLFEMGLGPTEVALVSGHSDLRMLNHYTHPKAEAIAAKLK